ILRIAQEEFGVDEFGLEHVLLDVRQKIISSVFGSLIQRLSEEYGRLYEYNHRTLEVLRMSGYELPAELRAVAEFSLGRQFDGEIRRPPRPPRPGRQPEGGGPGAGGGPPRLPHRPFLRGEAFRRDDHRDRAGRGVRSVAPPRPERAEPSPAQPQPPPV